LNLQQNYQGKQSFILCPKNSHQTPWAKARSSEKFPLAVQIRHQNFDIAAKFPDDLPARAARRRERVSVGDDADFCDFFCRADRLKIATRSGAHRQTV
jgi:hypothetical protein